MLAESVEEVKVKEIDLTPLFNPMIQKGGNNVL